MELVKGERESGMSKDQVSKQSIERKLQFPFVTMKTNAEIRSLSLFPLTFNLFLDPFPFIELLFLLYFLVSLFVAILLLIHSFTLILSSLTLLSL